MLEHREKVVSKDSEIEETEEFDTESPLPKAVELDMNIADTDQTKVSFIQIQQSNESVELCSYLCLYLLCRKQKLGI